MTSKQHKMAMKLLSANNKVALKDLSLEINERVNSVYELDLFIEGKKTVLFLGSKNECISTADEYIRMRYEISD